MSTVDAIMRSVMNTLAYSGDTIPIARLFSRQIGVIGIVSPECVCQFMASFLEPNGQVTLLSLR